MSSDDLLAILNAHGQQFMQSFPSSSHKRKRTPTPSPQPESESEWEGIVSDEEEEVVEGNSQKSAEDIVPSNVTVFSQFPTKSARHDPQSKAQKKAFMSSKISKVQKDVPGSSEKPDDPQDEEDERNHAQNDALLHRLVHTKLLSGSLNPELDLSPAKRRKALAGRVLELSGNAKLGRGESSVRVGERNKASKRVREGLLEKEQQRKKTQLEEAKNLGNYHPTLKSLYDDSTAAPRKRQRGLKMGVGKFSGGMLKLSKKEIEDIQGPRKRTGKGSSGRGRPKS
ncbi:hypothetical protein C8J56DRAFT_1135900 [Mycena floridula]|nr:hypothetical protein C8J56DRAFT_1135900 [Mycena floridula]